MASIKTQYKEEFPLRLILGISPIGGKIFSQKEEKNLMNISHGLGPELGLIIVSNDYCPFREITKKLSIFIIVGSNILKIFLSVLVRLGQ